jgi:hypothetical protein
MRSLPLLFLILSTLCSAQNILQDNTGKTSLNLNPGNNKADKEPSKIETTEFGLGLIKLSTAEKKLELNYYQYFAARKIGHSFFGISASGEIENSISSIFTSGDLASGTNINLRIGKRLFKRRIEDFGEWERKFRTKKNRDPTLDEKQKFVENQSVATDLWLITDGGFSGSKFKLFTPDTLFDKQIEKVTFTALNINAGLNYWSARLFNSTFLVGVTLGIKKENNFEDLTESTQEVVTVRTNSKDTTTRKVVEKNIVFQGGYKETTVYPLNFDIYFKPHKLDNLAFLLYSRTNISKSEKPKTKVGLGVYFLKKNNLFDPLFGINIDYKDVFDVDSDENDQSASNKFKIGIVTRLGLLKFQK